MHVTEVGHTHELVCEDTGIVYRGVVTATVTAPEREEKSIASSSKKKACLGVPLHAADFGLQCRHPMGYLVLGGFFRSHCKQGMRNVSAEAPDADM